MQSPLCPVGKKSLSKPNFRNCITKAPSFIKRKNSVLSFITQNNDDRPAETVFPTGFFVSPAESLCYDTLHHPTKDKLSQIFSHRNGYAGLSD
jgi:hypothetical protein